VNSAIDTDVLVVREASRIAFDDLGFAAHWLVIDLRPDDVEALSSIPAPCQWCEPTVAAAHATGATFHEIHARATAGELGPETPPLEVPPREA
jgi:hypothetical protein